LIRPSMARIRHTRGERAVRSDGAKSAPVAVAQLRLGRLGRHPKASHKDP